MSFASMFVRLHGREEGIGKLVGILADEAEIEYFDSPAGPMLRRVHAPTSVVEKVELAAQTRIFWHDPSCDTWMAGRVDGGLVSAKVINATEDCYHVRFPNGADTRVPISEIYVRSSKPMDDPSDYLAHRITDTPFFFDGRVELVRHIAQQRAAFGGLTGLASSAVELIEHQVLTIRRVLSDPIQRYLLADEVGLGKTIEAGVLIRQHVIDQGNSASVVVVVPDHLIGQWENELSGKFFLGGNPAVRIFSESGLSEEHVALLEPSMLVVDEAHSVCLDAFNPDPSMRIRYERLEGLAREAAGVLLLSGTPVLHRAEGFLAMLHLLEPEAYPLDELTSFRQRVQERRMIAEATTVCQIIRTTMCQIISKTTHTEIYEARSAKLH
jgi:ATP-dependent helicase HepA